MNLKDFTESVDRLSEHLEKADLICLLHNIARKVPEKNRDAFLVIMQSVHKSDKDSTQDSKKTAQKDSEKDIKKEAARVQKLFDSIEEGELCLEVEEYIDYDRSWGYDEGEYSYEDPDHVIRVYEEAAGLIEKCIDAGEYHTALDIFDRIDSTEVQVRCEWDDFTMAMDDLVEAKLLTFDLTHMALCVLYAAYQVTEPGERAEELYDYMNVTYFSDVHLEDMLTLGANALPGLPEFWDSWISLLSETAGDLARRLLKEAILCRSGDQGLLETARDVCKVHPSLYLDAMEVSEKSGDYAMQLEIGKEALEKINKKYVIRSQAALKTAEAAIRLDRAKEAEGYWLEAFRSCTVPVNYLRIIGESADPKGYLSNLASMVGSVAKVSSIMHHGPEELKENLTVDSNLYILQFLNGDFDKAIKQHGKELVFLLLFKEDDWKQGCLYMAKEAVSSMYFRAADYYAGTEYHVVSGKKGAENDMELFRRCFNRWKSLHHLSAEQEKSYLSAVEKMVDNYVSTTVSEQQRKWYAEAAAYAAALGEVKESLGEAGGKQRTMQKYKEQFPRHNAFHGELRNYGMQDTRKGKIR